MKRMLRKISVNPAAMNEYVNWAQGGLAEQKDGERHEPVNIPPR